MKIQIHFKTPDALYYAIEGETQYVEDEEEKEEIKSEILSVCEKFIKYGECVTIEIDTKTGTAEVLKAGG